MTQQQQKNRIFFGVASVLVITITVVFFCQASSGAMGAHMQDRREHFGELSAPTRLTYALAHGLSSVDYIQAQRLRTRAIATFEQVLEQVDAIITPTTAITAPLIPVDWLKDGWSDLSAATEKMRYAFPSNLTGHPTISFLVGYGPAGCRWGCK